MGVSLASISPTLAPRGVPMAGHPALPAPSPFSSQDLSPSSQFWGLTVPLSPALALAGCPESVPRLHWQLSWGQQGPRAPLPVCCTTLKGCTEHLFPDLLANEAPIA